MIRSARDVVDYAKSCIVVAEYNMNAPDGDLELARVYLEKVAASAAEDAERAASLLRLMKQRLEQKQEPPKQQETAGDDSGPSSRMSPEKLLGSVYAPLYDESCFEWA
jgi:hypothetical protein